MDTANIGSSDGSSRPPSRKRNFIEDCSGFRGSCKKCSEHFELLLKELDAVRYHGSIMRNIRSSQDASMLENQSLGRNHVARKQWLWTYVFDYYREFIAHASCIEHSFRTKLIIGQKVDNFLSRNFFNC